MLETKIRELKTVDDYIDCLVSVQQLVELYYKVHDDTWLITSDFQTKRFNYTIEENFIREFVEQSLGSCTQTVKVIEENLDKYRSFSKLFSEDRFSSDKLKPEDKPEDKPDETRDEARELRLGLCMSFYFFRRILGGISLSSKMLNKSLSYLDKETNQNKINKSFI